MYQDKDKQRVLQTQLIQDNQVTTLDEALKLKDHEGNDIDFKKQEDGTYIAHTKDELSKWTYTINPEPQKVHITVDKERLNSSDVPEPDKSSLQEKEKPELNKEEETIESDPDETLAEKERKGKASSSYTKKNNNSKKGAYKKR